ncbi:class I SAM-dependent methyltransferase [Bradyrhizobium sp.]|uniref:class I SAM-dependent methyltransferase n=1 Tax=Bradyrhizobium sp. TaxID=376 RepID=UPI003C54591E
MSMVAPTGRKATSRLDSFRRLLTHIHQSILPDLGFVLWDGSTVPADLRSDALAFVIADEGAVAAMMRRPNIDTFLNLWVTSRFDLRNGSFFDLAACRPKTRTRTLMKSFDKRLAAVTLTRFLFVPRGGPWPLEAARRGKVRVDGTAATNKTNIHYHYDLSNRFYELFLDPEMVYSCAYFKDWNNDLATAQADKLEMICRKLRLRPGDTFLDIGCGWGALVCHAARHYGVHAHGVTLSEEQFTYAKEKVARLGLEERVTLELRDYSLLEGRFDRIASIGMFEHVGIANHPTYFKTINRLLKPGGLYLHHAIALRSKSFERFRRGRRRDAAAATAIGRYIFPGGELDHVGMSIANLEMHNFEVHDVEAWREHYMRTTRLWHDRLSANREVAEREVGREKTRLWIAYLAVVSIAFTQGTIGIFQTLASNRVRGPSGLPPTRADLYR